MRSCLLFMVAFSGVAGPAMSARATELQTELSARFAGYLSAFDEGDAEALGRFWAADAVAYDDATGQVTEGRPAIKEEFADFFTRHPRARLTGQLDTVRAIRPEVAIGEGSVTLFVPDDEPTRSAFTIVLVKEGGTWVIESSHERELPQPTTPRDALQDFAWLVGDWRDESDAVDVRTKIRWSANEAFLIRSFQAEYKDAQGIEGTQVIGWDPRDRGFRTWIFSSDGSFGEGTIAKQGAGWLIKMTHVGGNGEVSAEGQLITRLADDAFQVEAIGSTIGGMPVPASDPVKVVRVVADQAASAAVGGTR
ncbi:SgcJ/EcaC family oxidoreductase [Botrimarina hoheduenensis]|uniref:SnoaL-like domain protein n=1 Tax=Botrimarina hoheduenensis TaxID=2528000 RepID=A0A5C5VQ83_9BACT|nr:SgcJ/EcaC family oxidoreductase [Botrimarina hoheduenensis]TWT40744.1 SnoaL-like domain protein [Botrimarina hoheduenensis]